MGAWRARLVVHPLTVASVVLLAVNDHWLKAQWPGMVTGKLSDVAGVWMVGALLIAAMGSVRWGAAVTALAFVALKTLPETAEWAAPVLGGVTRRDPTDVVALLALLPLGVLAQRLGARRSRRVNDAWSLIGAAFVLSAAMVTTTATSCDVQPEVTDVVLAADGTPIAHYRERGPNSSTRSFRLSERGTLLVPGVEVGTEATTEACVSGGCYRVEPDVGVYFDSTLVHEYTQGQRNRLSERPRCAQADAFGSIVAIEGDQGVDVWVSMGTAGVLHRDTDGIWQLMAVDGATPPLDDAAAEAAAASRNRSLALLIVPLVLAAVLAIALPLALSWWPRRRLVLTTLVAAAVNVGWAVGGYWWLGEPGDGDLPHAGPFTTVWVAVWAVLQLAWVLPVATGPRADDQPKDPPETPMSPRAPAARSPFPPID